MCFGIIILTAVGTWSTVGKAETKRHIKSPLWVSGLEKLLVLSYHRSGLESETHVYSFTRLLQLFHMQININ